VSLLDIRVLGDPILRQDTRPVVEVTDELRRLVDDMFATMHAAQGIGLAAPQVGRTERLTVIDVDDHPLVVINPEIVAADGKPTRAEEGCLSIPDVYADIERPPHVVVRALDLDGTAFEIDGTDLLARCLQHEIDHLHGKLFIDYLSVLKRRNAMAKWTREKEKYPGFVRTLTPSEIAEHHHRDEEL
jgi:peptide deformylase